MRVHHDSASAALVRRLLTEELRRAGVSPATVDEVVLIASELVGNAVRHTPAPPSGLLEVSWSLDDTGVTVGVVDASPTPPRPRTPTPQDPHGRGLRIVDALADGWGVVPHPQGKQVWAHVPARQRQHAMAG
jgi:anti-sigma regulatory factor (Ser/Thr protein kinase)